MTNRLRKRLGAKRAGGLLLDDLVFVGEAAERLRRREAKRCRKTDFEKEVAYEWTKENDKCKKDSDNLAN